MMDPVEMHRIKYYDSFLPNDMKIMNSSFKLLKYKIYSRDKNTLKVCMEQLNSINSEISNNLFDSKTY
jgi:hypothetical protein